MLNHRGVFKTQTRSRHAKPYVIGLSCRSLAFTSYKAFQKTKKGLEMVSLLHFLHDSSRKIFVLLCCIN